MWRTGEQGLVGVVAAGGEYRKGGLGGSEGSLNPPSQCRRADRTGQQEVVAARSFLQVVVAVADASCLGVTEAPNGASLYPHMAEKQEASLLALLVKGGFTLS